MKLCAPRSALLASLLISAGCATAPPPAASPTPVPPQVVEPPPPPPAPPAIPISRLICTVQEARRISFADLGVPEGSRAIDLALGKGKVWILFEPSLLVGVPRAESKTEPVAVAEYGALEETDMIPGPRPDAWRTVAVDPWDGTLWLASPSGLWRRRSGRRPDPVPVAGSPKGFTSVVAGRGAVWATPACSTNGIWKLDSKGKVLATALPQPDAPGGCATALLERDWSGDVLALRTSASGSGEVLRLAFNGTWEPAGDALVPPLPDGGVPLRSWFFWSTEPLALGGPADDPLLFRRIDGRVTAFHEDCGPGNALVRVEGDAQGWAALTREWLLLGEHSH